MIRKVVFRPVTTTPYIVELKQMRAISSNALEVIKLTLKQAQEVHLIVQEWLDGVEVLVATLRKPKGVHYT